MTAFIIIALTLFAFLLVDWRFLFYKIKMKYLAWKAENDIKKIKKNIELR